jgi:hypothetical protein
MPLLTALGGLVPTSDPQLAKWNQRIAAFDKELAALKQSGEFAKIVEPYGFSAKAAMSTSREKLCAAAK